MPNLKFNLFSNLRAKMRARDVDALIVLDSDPHLGEYIADYWKCREWISGFTGSNGVMVITQEHIGLWTDSRYFIQGDKELDGTRITLHKMIGSSDTYQDWLMNQLDNSSTIGFDGRLMSIFTLEQLKKKAAKKKFKFDSTVQFIEEEWIEGRPDLPTKKIFLFDDRYAGNPRKNKIESVREQLRNANADWLMVTALDEIAWIFNLRGRDVSYNPVFYAFALIGLKDCYLFINERKVPEAVKRVLENENVFIEEYDRAYSINEVSYGTIMVDVKKVNVTLYNQLRNSAIYRCTSPIEQMKAIKSTIEIQHINNAMIKDGQALTKAFQWLMTSKENECSEYDFSNKIVECRKEKLGYYGESFPAIVGYKENGAIVHYRPNKESALKIEPTGLLLCDSGGQYLDGTTDITRTFTLGDPTADEKLAYTLVLKGHIALATAKFPRGTNGAQLDILARQYLWQHDKNYGHGTGHGVGYFLNVHEGPQGISPRAHVILEPGMIVSNEPGYYAPGAYGIRIENLILVKECTNSNFLCFETITYFPIQIELVNLDLMTDKEINWLNVYHRKVKDVLIPELDDELTEWLCTQCREIEG